MSDYVLFLLVQSYVRNFQTFIYFYLIFFMSDYVLDLLRSSHGQLHDTFTRTYGVLYERNASLFRRFFDALREFYRW